MNPPDWFLESQKYIFLVTIILFIVGGVVITVKKSSMEFKVLTKPYMLILVVIAIPTIVMVLIKN